MFVQMVDRKKAVAVGEKKVRRTAGPHAVVAAEGDTKAAVRVGNPLDWEIGRAGKVTHNRRRLIRRAVVRDDDFEFPVHAPLQRQGAQRALQMRGALIGRENNRQFKSWMALRARTTSHCGA